jgi:predicted urease superfamily metal-dependent hydrolase
LASQVLELLFGEPKHEVRRKAVGVASDRSGESPCLNAVKVGQIGIQHYPVPAQEKDRTLDTLDRHE